MGLELKSYQLLFVCVIGIYTCFLTWGITQERVSTTEYNGRKFKYFVFLNIIQSLVASAVAYIMIKVRNIKMDKLDRPLLMQYVRLSLFSSLASPFGYASLKHIDYPTLILGKSCKLVPVVIMNFFLYRKTLPLKKYLVVLMITVGVSAFMLLHPKKKKSGEATSSLFGLLLLTINLMFDGAINSTQDELYKKFKVNGSSMMMYMNIFSSLMMAAFLLVNPFSTELSDAIAFCSQHPKIVFDIFLFGLAGAVGQCFIFMTLEHFGSLVLVTVTVTRKMFSIILSVMWFGHKLSLGQWGAVGLVFVAIAWESMGKVNTHADPIFKDEAKKKNQ
ncbi:UDP-galactose transporter [Boothiomyces macroporosus]|uniref:UDP-galactose transporter homolog 1 n=1 Tax=Boothiomyces macroporosus TaxID=261099 RepID=A0AAD5Y140_9FUNG|nr:UDP-galactose transporter [Boothiomyces macroporosus]